MIPTSHIAVRETVGLGTRSRKLFADYWTDVSLVAATPINPNSARKWM